MVRDVTGRDIIDQRDAILERDWDYLLVLDACRYDIFAEEVGRHLNGTLEKVRSAVDATDGIATSEWAKATFLDQYDNMVYVSSTPHINSRQPVRDFFGNAHFNQVIDVWQTDWDHEMGTVLPEDVNRAIVSASQDHPDKAIVGHYMQPHFPYLTLDNPVRQYTNNPSDRNSIRRRFRVFLGKHVRLLLGGPLSRTLLQTFNLPAPTPMHEVLREQGHDGLVEAYRDNLQLVLEAILELSQQVRGTIVITADHGEYLGEGGYYGHSYLPPRDVLTDVPWFTLDAMSNDLSGRS